MTTRKKMYTTKEADDERRQAFNQKFGIGGNPKRTHERDTYFDEDGFIHLASTKPRSGTEIKGEINWSLGREFTPWGFGTMPEREVKRKAEEREKKEEKEKKKKKS